MASSEVGGRDRPDINTRVRHGRGLLLGLLFGFEVLLSPARADVDEAQVAALVEALRLAAPSGSGRDKGLYSEWKIKPNNITRWSKRCTGEALTPTEFELSPTTARQVLVCVMEGVLNEQYAAGTGDEQEAVRRVAAWWLTGQPERHADPAIASYVDRVQGHYRQQRHSAQQQTSAAEQPPSTLPPIRLESPLRPAAPGAPPSGIGDAQVAALVEALRLAAPRTGRADDDLYSDWQIRPDNIPRWSKRCLGRELSPTQLEADPAAARAMVNCVMLEVLSEQYRASNGDELLAVQRAAAWWMTGDPEQYDSGAVAAYTREVLDFYVIRRKIDAG